MTDIKNPLNHNEIGLRIRQERDKLGLSREKFAELVGLSAFFIGQIERGDRKMSIDTLVAISDILNVSVDYLLFGLTHYMENIVVMETYDNIYKESTDEEIRELLEILKGSTDRQISVIKDICKVVLPSIRK
ncbi:MAG: helix-turn-helix transcriptional regulator [Tissierellaceae bacterium]|nr:helix-turn-helix transcriptional regulator [Tissierellaceae bacterium]